MGMMERTDNGFNGAHFFSLKLFEIYRRKNDKWLIFEKKKSLRCNKIHAVFCLSLACFSSLMELSLFCTNIYANISSELLLSKRPKMSNCI